MTVNPDRKEPINLRQFGFHPLSLRLWHGMALDAWLRAMRGKWHMVSPSRYPLVAMITLFSISNLGLKWLSQLIYGRRLAKVEIVPDPIFVIGHWRSGTTWLHQLMISDPRHAAPDVRACFRPETFLVGRGILTPILRWALREKRPMDNVRLKLESAEEDEHGISLSGALSPYRHSMFPNDERRVPANPDDMAAEDAAFWRKKWLAFLTRVQFVNPGKRLVLKSPTHTMRTKEILRIFPDAKFIHIVRDPYKVFLSNRNSRTAMYSVSSLQDHLPSQENRDASMIKRSVAFHKQFDQDRRHIPDDQIITLRYEDLRADPMASIRTIYSHLDLGDFALIEGNIGALVGPARPYQNNRYKLDDQTRAMVDDQFADFFEQYGYVPMDQRPAAAP